MRDSSRVRSQLRVGSGLSWAVAWLLAIGGAVLYLLAPGSATWWLETLLAAPLIALVMIRAERHPFDAGGGGGMEGPYEPPSDFGGGGHGH